MTCSLTLHVKGGGPHFKAAYFLMPAAGQSQNCVPIELEKKHNMKAGKLQPEYQQAVTLQTTMLFWSQCKLFEEMIAKQGGSQMERHGKRMCSNPIGLNNNSIP